MLLQNYGMEGLRTHRVEVLQAKAEGRTPPVDLTIDQVIGITIINGILFMVVAAPFAFIWLVYRLWNAIPTSKPRQSPPE